MKSVIFCGPAGRSEPSPVYIFKAVDIYYLLVEYKWFGDG